MPLGTIARIGVWVLAVSVALLSPPALESFWARIEGLLRTLARRKLASCALMALLVLAGRAALLPVWDIPKPYVADEFGYLLQSDTFASGRLTNPPHPMGEFFNATYILQKPTYSTKFPPGQGLFMALGQVIFGHPWFGVWLSCAALASALCWALQGWFEPEWALLGAVLVLPLCTLSYWMNSYWGGAVAGIGGALVFGALPRLKSGQAVVGGVFALGASLLALTRPFEGLVVLMPASLALLFQRLNLRQWAAILFTGCAGAGFILIHNMQVTGDPLRVPYLEYEKQYPMTSHFNLRPLPPQREFPESGITLIDHWERSLWARSRRPDFVMLRLNELAKPLTAFLGSPLLLLPLAFFFAWWKDPTFRPIRWAVGLTIVVAFLEVLFFDHYAAPVLCPLLILVVAGFRQLRQWKFIGAKPAGAWLTRMMPLAALLIAVSDPAVKIVRRAPLYDRSAGGRELLEKALEQELGPHLILVHQSDVSKLDPHWSLSDASLAPVAIEFVHNSANIDQQPIIWANDFGDEASRRRLLDYFKHRTVWLYNPEVDPDNMHRLTDVP